MKKSAEVISTLLDRVSNTSMPVSAEDQELRDLLRGALLYRKESDAAGQMTRTMPTSGEPAGEQSGSFSLDDLDIKYSLDDLLDKTEGMLDSGIPSDDAEQKVYHLFEQAVLRSRADSKLEAYNYDMVYAITQRALNAAMKEYIDLMGASSQGERRYYVARQDSSPQGFHTEEASAEETAFFDTLHLFDIPARAEDRTHEQVAQIIQADEKALLYAFHGAFGIPEDAELSEVGNIVELIPGQVTNSTCVNYNMYFSKLCIVELKYNPFKRKTEFTKTEQAGHSPWVFRFKVNLGLIGVSRSQLPESVAKEVNNIDPESMFSIQQLFLDLNTVKLQDALPIPNVSEDASSAVNDKFTKVYFQKLRNTADQGSVVFAYALKPNDGPSDRPYLLKPSDFCFYISPYYENGKENPKKGALYTLNYILACDGRMLPRDLKSFTWNWVDEKDAAAIHGSMSINKQRIYDFANNQFTDIIRILTLKPNVYVSFKHNEFRIGFDHGSENAKFENNTYNFSAEASDADGLKIIKAKAKYSLDASVSSYQTTDDKAVIECKCDITCYLNMKIGGGTSKGNIFNKTIWYTLTIDIDEYGRLLIQPSVTEKDNGTSFSYNTFSKIISLGTAKGAIEFAKTALESELKDTNAFSQRDFTQRYNRQAMWVLPGNRTFVFKQPRFSCGTDLTFDISYAKAHD